MKGYRVRPTRGAYAAAAIGLGLTVAARTTGSGWLTVLISLVAGILVWSVVRPLVALRAMKLDLAAPADGLVGRSFDMTVDVDGPSDGVVIEPVAPAGPAAWANPPDSGRVAVTPIRRGVLRSVQVRCSTAAGLGLVWASRDLAVPLPRPVDVAPRPTPVVLASGAVRRGQGEQAVGARHSDGETVRSVREYAMGDPLRMIHWGVSARHDELVVKELESPQSPTLVVEVDLRGDPDVAERHASLAAGYVQAGLRNGLPVVLRTLEESGLQSGGVGSNLEAGRRLARAVPGYLPPATTEGRAAVIRLGPR